MKGHKAHHHAKKAHGGEADGRKDWEEDLRENPEMRVNAPKIKEEAEAKKAGGRAKRKHGGHVLHHHMGHVKHVGHVEGHAAKHHAGRKPRKAGGRTGSNEAPLSSAHRGEKPAGRHMMEVD